MLRDSAGLTPRSARMQPDTGDPYAAQALDPYDHGKG
jgi:hypothetical protein